MHLLRRPILLTAILVVSLAVAACSSPDSGPAMVSQGTEAWRSAAPAADPAASSAQPTDPTMQLPVVPAEEPGQEPAPQPDLAAGGAATATAPLELDADVAAILAGMSVEQKVGQLFAVSVVGASATDPSPSAQAANRSLYGVATPAEVVRTYHLGGIAYLDHDMGAGTSNVDDVLAVGDLSAGLQAAAAADTGIGLLIGADQEGGRVVRLRQPATVFPAARQIGSVGDLALAEQVGQATGLEAAALGINWVFAPVADVNVNPDNPVIGDRAFGITAEAVTPMVQATARGLIAAGALPTLKHFPGHGDTNIDSHSSLPTIDHDLQQLASIDLPPFRIAAADPARYSVMTGHLAVPAIDPSGRPATISPEILAVLRGDLGFSGLVVTDAMNMGALSGFGDAGSLAVQAIGAGNDIVLMPTDLPAAYAAVLDAISQGRLPMASVDAAVARILRTKEALGILRAAQITTPDPAVVGSEAHRGLRAELGQACGC